MPSTPRTGAAKMVYPFSKLTKKIWGDAAYDNGTIYFGSLDAKLVRRGCHHWHQKMGHTLPVDSLPPKPLIVNGVIYFGALNKLIALDAASGKPKMGQRALLTRTNGFGRLSLPKMGRCMSATTAGKVYAFDAGTGDSKWAQPFSPPEDQIRFRGCDPRWHRLFWRQRQKMYMRLTSRPGS